MQGIRMIEHVRFSHDDDVVHCARPLQLTPQARYELTCICTGHNLLLLLLPTTMPHMLGVQDEDSRVECDEMAE